MSRLYHWPGFNRIASVCTGFCFTFSLDYSFFSPRARDNIHAGFRIVRNRWGKRTPGHHPRIWWHPFDVTYLRAFTSNSLMCITLQSLSSAYLYPHIIFKLKKKQRKEVELFLLSFLESKFQNFQFHFSLFDYYLNI